MEINGQQLEANKDITLNGTPYRRGDVIDTSQLPDHKVGQLLNLRILRPSMVGVEDQPQP